VGVDVGTSAIQRQKETNALQNISHGSRRRLIFANNWMSLEPVARCHDLDVFFRLFLVFNQAEVFGPVISSLDVVFLSSASRLSVHDSHRGEGELDGGSEKIHRLCFVGRIGVLRIVKNFQGQAEVLGAAIVVAPPLLDRVVEAEKETHEKVQPAKELCGHRRSLHILLVFFALSRIRLIFDRLINDLNLAGRVIGDEIAEVLALSSDHSCSHC